MWRARGAFLFGKAGWAVAVGLLVLEWAVCVCDGWPEMWDVLLKSALRRARHSCVSESLVLCVARCLERLAGSGGMGAWVLTASSRVCRKKNRNCPLACPVSGVAGSYARQRARQCSAPHGPGSSGSSRRV